MKLQSKVIIILTSMWIVISLFLFVDAKFTLLRNYESIEHTQIIFDSERMQNKIPQILHTKGVMTIQHYLIIILVLGIIDLLAVWYLLKILVLNRLINVSKQVVNINSQSKFSNRILISGNDEIGQMVNAINSLMEIIELTQDQLRYRISQRTEKLEKLSNLNKNLFNEMNKQKEVENKLRADEKLLRLMAYYDNLTDLPNRLYFNELLEKALSNAKNTHTSIAVLFIDVDKFKSINDTYGHDIGDKFIQHIAKKLKSVIRDVDVVARYSGDEFIVYLKNVNEKTIINSLCNRILDTIYTPMCLGEIEIKSTFSVGISLFPQDGTTTEELERQSDAAMYHAKKQSGNSFSYFDEIQFKVATEK